MDVIGKRDFGLIPPRVDVERVVHDVMAPVWKL